MDQLIYRNSKTLSPKDIFLQLAVGLGILLLVGLLSPIRNNGQDSASIFFLLGTALLVIWTIRALQETTLKMVEISNEQGKISFVINRQLKSDRVFDFQLTSLSLDIKTKADRSLPQNKILTIKDNNSTLTISSRQKGLSEQILNEIVDKVKHNPQQRL